MSRRVAIILGHPDSTSFCGALADAYATAAREAGHAVSVHRLGDLQFDPILHHGYARIQPLEPDLLAVQQAITDADRVVFVYPTWWGSMPALLQGFFERAFLPGYAFRYRKDSSLWDRLLSGRSARVITTMDTPPWYYRWIFRQPGHQQIRRTILEFCGIRPVHVAAFGPVRNSSDAQRATWLERTRLMGRTD